MFHHNKWLRSNFRLFQLRASLDLENNKNSKIRAIDHEPLSIALEFLWPITDNWQWTVAYRWWYNRSTEWTISIRKPQYGGCINIWIVCSARLRFNMLRMDNNEKKRFNQLFIQKILLIKQIFTSRLIFVRAITFHWRLPSYILCHVLAFEHFLYYTSLCSNMLYSEPYSFRYPNCKLFLFKSKGAHLLNKLINK